MLSANGRYVAFIDENPEEDPNGTDAWVLDRSTGTTTHVSVSSTGVVANAASSQPAISADGRYVAFASDATNLVPGDTNGMRDVFVYDGQAKTTSRVSVTSAGGQARGASAAPGLSADGRYVLFSSSANNLVTGDTNGRRDVFVHVVHVEPKTPGHCMGLCSCVRPPRGLRSWSTAPPS